MKSLLRFFFFIVSLNSISQQKFSKSISLLTDNDLYISTNRDRYYTSGIFLTYNYLVKNNNQNIEKKIFEWQIGHEMFTPISPIVKFISKHDRPFAAHLFTGFNIKRALKNNTIINTSIKIGVLGPKALGDELQNAIHSLYGFREVTGWKHQIKGAFSVNFGAEYMRFLGKDETNTLDATWVNSTSVGTVYTHVSTGLHLRFGFLPLQNITNSIAFNTLLNNKATLYNNNAESFLYFKPTIRYAFYDATIQGSFLNSTSEVTKELIPLVFDMELGFRCTINRFNLGYVFNYNTSKSKNLQTTYGNIYGTIILNYMIR